MMTKYTTKVVFSEDNYITVKCDSIRYQESSHSYVLATSDNEVIVQLDRIDYIHTVVNGKSELD